MPTQPVNVNASTLARKAREWVEHFPDLHELAITQARAIIFKHTGRQLDPEKVWWHRFDRAVSTPASFSGWEHRGPPLRSLTFVQLMLQRFAASDQDDLDTLQVMGGFYTDGAEHSWFDQRNEVRMLAAPVSRDFWAIDFAATYTHALRTFWDSRGDDFILLAKTHFLAQVARQAASGRLGREELRMLRHGLGARVSQPLTLDGLLMPAPAQADTRLYSFDIAGLRVPQALRVVNGQGRQVLYLPGGSPSLLAFANRQALYDWVREQAASPTGRQRLLRHLGAFAPLQQSEQDKANRALDTFASDAQGAHIDLLNQAEQHIQGDGFQALRSLAITQMSQQAQRLLMSNAHLTSQLWTRYLGAFIGLAGVAAPVAWPLALVVVGAGVANVILNSIEAVHAADTQQRRQAIINAISSAITAAFSLPFVFADEALAAEGPLNSPVPRPAPIEVPDSGESLALIQLHQDNIVLQAGERWNSLGLIERIDVPRVYLVHALARGETASPAGSLVPRETLRFDFSARLRPGKVVRTFASVPGALEYAKAELDGPFVVYEVDSQGLACASLRHNLQYNWRFTLSRQGLAPSFMQEWAEGARALEDFGDGAWLFDEVHLQLEGLEPSRSRLMAMSELEAPLPSLNDAGVIHQAPTLLQGVRVLEPSAGEMRWLYSIEAGGTRQYVRYDLFSASWRPAQGTAYRYNSATGGFDLLTALPTEPESPSSMQQALDTLNIAARIPLEIEIPDAEGSLPLPRKIHSIWLGGPLPRRLASLVLDNARVAARGANPFECHLYLSIGDPQALRDTLKLLEQRPANLHLHTLEQTPFFEQFRQSPFYPQYRSASSGPAINYASAVDTLRYQLLRMEGGLYMDVDDWVHGPSDTRRALGDVQMKVKPGELMLNGLASHPRLGMIIEFNNSNFGSLPDNPLLDRISEESLQRYLRNRDLFRSRPYDYKDSQATMDAYARRISHVSGPQMFNAVIDRELPAFRQYRGVVRLTRGELYFDEARMRALRLQQRLATPHYSPLQDVLGIGSTASWLHTR